MADTDREPQTKRPLLAAGARPDWPSGGGQGTLLSLGARAPAPGAPREARMAGLYDLQEVIGKGHFATVRAARHVFTGERVAVKAIEKSKLDPVSRAHLFQEVMCLKLVQHPHIVRLYEVIDTSSKLYLVLELGSGGDLYDYITKHKEGLEESVARHFFLQVVSAISYCHQLHVCHRDIKPENIIFFEGSGSRTQLPTLKIADFGFSQRYTAGAQLHTTCGSLCYSAPEILLGEAYDPPCVDIWSLGVLLFMLVYGFEPFQEANESETLTKILDARFTLPAYRSEQCKRLIRRCLVREPSERATLEDILADAWLTPAPSPELDAAAPADVAASAKQRAGGGGAQLIAQRSVAECTHALVTQLQLSRSEFEALLRQMEEGGVAPRDEVLSALEQDRYDYLTATFFLLAERHLRERSLRTAELPDAPPAQLAAARPLALQGHISPAPHARTRRMPHQQSSTLKSPSADNSTCSVLSPLSPAPGQKPFGRTCLSPSCETAPPMPIPPAAQPHANVSSPSPQLSAAASARDELHSSAGAENSAQAASYSPSPSPSPAPPQFASQCRSPKDATGAGLAVKRYEGPRRGSWAPLSQQQQQLQQHVIAKLGARSISRTSITSLVLPGILSPSSTLPHIGEREQSPSSQPKAVAARLPPHPVHVLNRESSGFSVRSTHSDSSRKSSSSMKPQRSALELLASSEHYKLATSRQAFSMDKASAADESNKSLVASSTPLLLHASTIGCSVDAILEEEPDAVGSNSDSLKRPAPPFAAGNGSSSTATAAATALNASTERPAADASETGVRTRERNALSAAVRPSSAMSARQMQRLYRCSPSSKSHSSSEASDAADEAEPTRRALAQEAAALPYWSGSGGGGPEFERLHKGQKRRPLARIAPIRRDSDLNDALSNATVKVLQPAAPPPLDEEAPEADGNDGKEAVTTRSVSSVSSSEHAVRTESPGTGGTGVYSGATRSRPVSRVHSASAAATSNASAAVRLKLWLRERTHSEALNGLLSKHSARSHSACTRLSDILSSPGSGGAAGNGAVSAAALAKARQNSLPIGYRPTRSNVVTRTQTTELEPEALARLEETLALVHKPRSSSSTKRHASAPPSTSPLLLEAAAHPAPAEPPPDPHPSGTIKPPGLPALSHKRTSFDASCATIREEEYCIESETCTLTGSEFYSDAEETIENLAALVQGGGAHGGESLEDEAEEQDGAGPLVSATRPLKGMQRLRKRHSNFSIASSFSLAESTSPSLSSLCSRALARGSRATASRGLCKNMAVLQVSNEPDVRISYTSALPPLPSFYLPDKIPDVFLIVNTIDRARTTDDWIDLKRAEQQNNELLEQAAREAPRERRPRATRQHTCLASGNERPTVTPRVRIRRRRAQSFDSLLKHLSFWSRASTVDSEVTRPDSTLTRHTLFSPTQQRAGGSQVGNHVSSGGTEGVTPEQSTQVTVTISLPRSNRKKTLQVRIPRRLPRRATQESLSDPPLDAACGVVCSSVCRRESATSSQLTGARGAADSSAGTSLTSLLATPMRSWVWSSAMKRHLRSLGIFSEEHRAEPIASEAAPLLLRAHSSSQHPPPPSTPLDASPPAAASPAPPADENTTPNSKAPATASKKPPATTACCRLS